MYMSITAIYQPVITLQCETKEKYGKDFFKITCLTEFKCKANYFAVQQ